MDPQSAWGIWEPSISKDEINTKESTGERERSIDWQPTARLGALHYTHKHVILGVSHQVSIRALRNYFAFRKMLKMITDRENRFYLLLIVIIPAIYYIYQIRPRLTAHRQSSFDDRNETTIVIVYFPLAKAKHTQSMYLLWLENLLSFCQSPMVIFTSPEYRPTLHRLRRNGSLPSFFIVDYNSPLRMPPIQSLVSTFKRQHPSDPERAAHSIELYAVWCAKAFVLNRSVELNPFDTEYFLYVDAGAFRSSKFRFQQWPHAPAIHSVLKDQRLLLGMIAPLPRRYCPLHYTVADGPIRTNLIQAGFIGGSADAIHWWTSVFYETIDQYRAKDLFIGKEEWVMNALVLTHAARINMMLAFRTPCKTTWFAFEVLLASKEERRKLEYPQACQELDLPGVIIPFDVVCDDEKNLS